MKILLMLTLMVGSLVSCAGQEMDAKAHHNHGLACVKKGDLDGAMADLTKVIEVNPRDTKAYSDRGTVRYQKGDKDGAMEDFNKAIEVDPEYVEAYYLRGAMRYGRGNYEGAIRDWTKVAELRPSLKKEFDPLIKEARQKLK